MGRMPCCEKNGLKKGPWTPDEDQKLIDYIKKHGFGNWRTLPKNAGLQRCGKSCRLRWTNYLRPDIKRGKFSLEEEETIVQLHGIFGNKWSAIAARLPGRTDNEIKNYWNTHIRKKLLRMGIDPVSHNPRLDLIDVSSLFNSSSQMNLAKIMLGMQVTPELLALANSLFSTQQQHQNYPYSLQPNNNQENQLFNPLVPKQMTPYLQSTQFQTPVQEIKQSPEIVQPTLENFSLPNLHNFSPQNCHASDGQCYVPVQDYAYQQGYFNNFDMGYQAPSDTTFQSNQSTTLSYQSASSSPVQLNSTSTAYVTGSCTTEDERESNCSGIVKFEIPDMLDINHFM